MEKIFVLEQKSTGELIHKESTERPTLSGWEKLVVKRLLRTPQKERFHEVIKRGDYVASWYGPDYDALQKAVDKDTFSRLCNHVFKEYAEDRLTRDELFAILHKVSEANKKKPLEVKRKQKKYYETNL